MPDGLTLEVFKRAMGEVIGAGGAADVAIVHDSVTRNELWAKGVWFIRIEVDSSCPPGKVYIVSNEMGEVLNART